MPTQIMSWLMEPRVPRRWVGDICNSGRCETQCQRWQGSVDTQRARAACAAADSTRGRLAPLRQAGWRHVGKVRATPMESKPTRCAQPKSSNPVGAHLRNVQRDERGRQADANARQQAASQHAGQPLRTGAHQGAGQHWDGVQQEGPLAAQRIGQAGACHRAHCRTRKHAADDLWGQQRTTHYSMCAPRSGECFSMTEDLAAPTCRNCSVPQQARERSGHRGNANRPSTTRCRSPAPAGRRHPQSPGSWTALPAGR